MCLFWWKQKHVQQQVKLVHIMYFLQTYSIWPNLQNSLWRCTVQVYLSKLETGSSSRYYFYLFKSYLYKFIIFNILIEGIAFFRLFFILFSSFLKISETILCKCLTYHILDGVCLHQFQLANTVFSTFKNNKTELGTFLGISWSLVWNSAEF